MAAHFKIMCGVLCIGRIYLNLGSSHQTIVSSSLKSKCPEMLSPSSFPTQPLGPTNIATQGDVVLKHKWGGFALVACDTRDLR